jgi:hypothetical protein
MAELGMAAIGAGVAVGADAYTTATGFVARHENALSADNRDTVPGYRFRSSIWEGRGH